MVNCELNTHLKKRTCKVTTNSTNNEDCVYEKNKCRVKKKAVTRKNVRNDSSDSISKKNPKKSDTLKRPSKSDVSIIN